MLNCVELIGRLTRDPEVRRTAADIAVTSFTIAVDRDYSSGADKETDFINIVAWRSAADYAGKYFHKGDLVAIKGRLQMRAWTDKDGNKRISAEVIADNVYSAGGKKSADTATTAPAAASDFGAVEDNIELPF